MMPQRISNELLAKVSGMADSIINEWEQLHSSVPFLLYHYTSADGLLGILNSRSFWMTNLKYLNDFSELQYGAEVVGRMMDKKKEEFSSNEAVVVFLNRVRPASNTFAEGIDFYSTSFCQNGNLLSQWRAYGDKGGGYSLGFDLSRLTGFFSRECSIRKVIYDPATQEQLVSEFCDEFCVLLDDETKGKALDDYILNYLIPSFCQVFTQVVTEFIFCFKHPNFEQEQEWRLVFAFRSGNEVESLEQEKEVEFRSFGGNIIPYVSVSFDNAVQASSDDTFGLAFPVSQMIIGPTISPELNRQSVAALVRKFAPDVTPTILKSGIPLRWL